MPGQSWKGRLPTVLGQQLDPLLEQVDEVIDKCLGQVPRRYPGEFFFVTVNRFTLVRQTGSDDPNEEVTQAVARSGSAPMASFDSHVAFGE